MAADWLVDEGGGPKTIGSDLDDFDLGCSVTTSPLLSRSWSSLSSKRTSPAARGCWLMTPLLSA